MIDVKSALLGCVTVSGCEEAEDARVKSGKSGEAKRLTVNWLLYIHT